MVLAPLGPRVLVLCRRVVTVIMGVVGVGGGVGLVAHPRHPTHPHRLTPSFHNGGRGDDVSAAVAVRGDAVQGGRPRHSTALARARSLLITARATTTTCCSPTRNKYQIRTTHLSD